MNIDLNEFKQEVHANAISHGWWGEEYTDAVVIALIHAEVSEALEEWRANRPMVYYKCRLDTVCNGDCKHDADTCVYKDNHPEGIAVELIDVVLRILDAAAAWDVAIDETRPGYAPFDAAAWDAIKDISVPELVNILHRQIAYLDDVRESAAIAPFNPDALSYPMFMVFQWLNAHGIDPEPVLLEKHRYNQTRPYRHGGKRI